MKWIAALALSAAVRATTGVLAQSHIRCQPVIGGPCGDSSRPREMNCCDDGYCQPWNSGYYQCLARPVRCPSQETDIDYKGRDLKTLYGLSPDQCCDACAASDACRAYTFVNENPDGKTACYLKSATTGRVEKKGAVSGVLLQAPAACPTQEFGVDYYGNDLTSIEGLLQGECCDACGETAGCTAYTWIDRDADGRMWCYLKSSDAGRKSLAGAISGKLKAAPPPPPANCPTQEVDVDYYGNDLTAVYGGSNAQCCDACATTSGCTAYTFVAQNADGKSACYLKSSSAGKRAKAGAVSSQLQCPTPLWGACGSSATGALCCPAGAFCQPWNPGYYQCVAVPDVAKCPKVVAGVDFFGGDLEVQYGLLPGACCDACFAHKDCVVFTFVNYNENGKSACYLKRQLVEQRANARAVSGYKIKPT